MPRVAGFLFVLLSCFCAVAETKDAAKASATGAVVMLSDLHFDPFHDPGKFELLRSAPVEGWKRILEAPATATQAKDFAALQMACKARGEDSSWDVLVDSLKAAQKTQPHPLFVTVDGDLLAHLFQCRMLTLRASATPEEQTQFASKTVRFVAMELHKTFPGTPVYLALGNNDSGCADYKETLGSEFLHDAAQSFAQDVNDKVSEAAIEQDASDLGDYDVPLPAPMQHTRLIVLQDIFQSRLYEGCGGTHTPDAAAKQIAWLRSRLEQAQQAHEHAWVMAHIPSGVDVYASFHRFVLRPAEICSVKQPVEFLGSSDFVHAITDFADVVKLAVFAHTHMDEMRLLHNEAGASVPAKLTPSVSPVNGNTPAFTVGRVDTDSGMLRDYSVYARGTASGVWGEEYTYSKLYGMPDYSAASVKKLTTALLNDKSGDAETSRKYEKWFFPGDTGLYALGLRQIWPAYSCATALDGEALQPCMCPVAAQPAAKP